MIKWLIGFLDRICAVAGAVVCSQIPMFIQQYHQQLFGRVAELKLQMDAIAQIATQNHKSVEQFIQKFLDSGDPDFIRQGDLLLWMTDRYMHLTEALHHLSTATTFIKPYVFLHDLNWEVARSTFANFQPGISFNSEGVFYALIGIVIGYGFFYFLASLIAYIYQYFILLTQKSS